jgi:hypothetical protein
MCCFSQCLQFAIAKPTERYTAVLDCLPAVYVAPERAVAQLVQVGGPLCLAYLRWCCTQRHSALVVCC